MIIRLVRDCNKQYYITVDNKLVQGTECDSIHTAILHYEIQKEKLRKDTTVVVKQLESQLPVVLMQETL
jgi:hypothetical protein